MRSAAPAAGAISSTKIGIRVDDHAYEMIKKVAELTNRSPSELIRDVLQAAYPRK